MTFRRQTIAASERLKKQMGFSTYKILYGCPPIIKGIRGVSKGDRQSNPEATDAGPCLHLNHLTPLG